MQHVQGVLDGRLPACNRGRVDGDPIGCFICFPASCFRTFLVSTLQFHWLLLYNFHQMNRIADLFQSADYVYICYR